MSKHPGPSPCDSPPPAGTADVAWLEGMLREYQAGLTRLVVGVLGDREAAADVVQITFAKAIEARGTFQPEAVKAWLYRVAFNEAITYRRRQQVDRRAREAAAPLVERSVPRPEEQLVRRELVEQVREAIGKLSPSQQEVLRLRIYEERTFADIAAQTGAPLGTVLTHMRRGLARLRELLARQ